MAAVTVNSRQKDVVMGDKLILFYDDVDIASSGDTLDTNMKAEQVWGLSQQANITSISISSGVVTFTTGAAITGAAFAVVGRR